MEDIQRVCATKPRQLSVQRVCGGVGPEQGAIPVVAGSTAAGAVVIVDSLRERVGSADGRSTESFVDSGLQPVVRHIPERLNVVQVGGQVRKELPAGLAAAGNPCIDIDIHRLV